MLIAISLGIIVLSTIGVLFWGVLVGYVNPGAKGATDRKDVVQAFALILAGVVAAIGGIVGIFNLQTSRHNLQQQRDLEEQRAQQDALQSYFEEVGNLLTAHNLKHAKPEDTVALLARAQTLSVLRRLDKDRKRILLLFLHEAGLISKEHRVIDLSDADLGEADLRYAPLSRADLRKANLFKAVLHGANLRDALLNSANLRFAELNYAHLDKADLSGPKPWYVLDIGTQNWEQEGGADLRDADLYRAFLRGADLTNANLSSAKLEGASFNDADLSRAYLRYAEGMTDELHTYAKSLNGAVMPNGQRYERWLLDRGNRGEHLTDRQKAHLEAYANKCAKWLKDKEGRGDEDWLKDLPLDAEARAKGLKDKYAKWLKDKEGRGDEDFRGEDSRSVSAYLDKYASWLRYREGRGEDLTDGEKGYLTWFEVKESRSKDEENSNPL